MKGRLLVVAGSDSGGGAGIQADIRAASAMGAYTMTAVTALTAQDTRGVRGVHPVPPAFVAAQIEAPLRDIGADAVKTGMLHDGAVIEAAFGALDAAAPGAPRIVDPVMAAKGGDPLLAPEAEEALRRRAVPAAFLLTPNAPEAERLAGAPVDSEEAMRAAGERLRAMGARAVLVKGGHLDGPRVVDLLVGPEGVHRYEGPRIDSPHTHGTGCTLASAAAAGIAQGMEPAAAVARARGYVVRAIREAPGFGGGRGPLNHLVAAA